MPSFDYKTNPIIYYPDSITVDTHDCTIEDIPENERPVKGMEKCLRCDGSYISFDNVYIYKDKDFSIDFWFKSSDSNYGRVIDFGYDKEGRGEIFHFPTNNSYYQNLEYVDTGWGFSSDWHGKWTHFVYQYLHTVQMSLVFLNGLVKINTNKPYDTISVPYAYLGKSQHAADPNINALYSGIRLQYGLVYNNLDARSLKYFNTTMTNLKTS